jgi:uncharacterized protein YndB with AHSA1/START domain
MRNILAISLCILALASAARAEVVEQSAVGFRTRNVVEVTASPEAVYRALGEIGKWWNGAHSYSGKATNMTMPLSPGACFCETMGAGGGVAHGRVVAALPSRMLRIEAALGPLQNEAVSGALTFELKAKGTGTEIIQTYHVGGMHPDRTKTFAPIVDGVVREQLTRLGRYVETGKPD